MHKKTLLIATLLCLGSAAVQAHDAWIVPAGGQYRILYGHGADTLGYVPAKVKTVTVAGVQNEPVSFTQSAGKDSVTIQPSFKSGMLAPVGMLTVVFDNGFWTKTATEDYLNESKLNHPDYLEAFHSMKFGKSIFAWNDADAKPVGLELEIVPLTNPFLLKVGEMLPVQVFYQGKPLPEALVGYAGKGDKDDSNKVKANQEGRAEFALREGGLIVAAHRVPLAENPDADAKTLAANLYLAAP